MRSNLTNEILLHIFSNIGLVVPSKVSVQSDTFLLDKTILLEDDGGDKELKLWGAEVDINGAKLRMLLTDITVDKREKEYILVVKLDNCPSYACYILLESTVVDKNVPRHGKIFFSLEEQKWLETNTYLQATFLAGMEQLKDVLSNWTKVSKDDDLVEDIKALIPILFEDDGEE